MRIASSRDLGLYVRDRRRNLGKTQTDLSTAAGVSRRWLSDLEAGKATVEIGLILRTLHALGLVLDAQPNAQPNEAGPDEVNLDDLLGSLRTSRD
jgi:y4mF family transcriptional regulator